MTTRKHRQKPTGAQRETLPPNLGEAPADSEMTKRVPPVRQGRVWLFRPARFAPFLFLALIHIVLLFNALYHDPTVGYDAHHHLRYIGTLSAFKLPTLQETYEFFSPPLPYLLPALLRYSEMTDDWTVAKCAQILNVFYSLGLCLSMVGICRLLRPESNEHQCWALLFIGIMPVYYKSFSFIRGEPLLAFMVVLALYQTIRVFVKHRWGAGNIILLGLVLGGAILSRQWGFFLFPAIGLLVIILLLKDRSNTARYLTKLVSVFVIAGGVGGWFYAHLYAQAGTCKAFNRTGASSFSFSNQPLEFYFDLGIDKVFTDPIRPAFTNRLLPTFYSEFWGDYECYFLVYGRDRRTEQYVSGGDLEREVQRRPVAKWLETNRFDIRGYLGRAQACALLPSAIFIGGVCLGVVVATKWVLSGKTCGAPPVLSLCCFAIVACLAGYFWFLVMYPVPAKGDTIKATYMLQVYPCVAILGAELMVLLHGRSIRWYRTLAILVALSAVHNIPLLFTVYVTSP